MSTTGPRRGQIPLQRGQKDAYEPYHLAVVECGNEQVLFAGIGIWPGHKSPSIQNLKFEIA